MHLWDSLSEAGVKFFTNPASPYETVSEDPNFPVDYAQFPRETLKRKSGQCDDLVTLFIAMLDGAKVPAAVLDYPGHMALMFDTESDSVVEAGLPEESLVLHDGTYWVPLEATLIGKSFPEAVAKAAYAYKAENEKGKVSVISVGQAWATYEPATMPASDWTAEVPKPETREKRFAEESATLAADRYKSVKKYLEGLLKADPKDADALVELGLLEYQSGNKDAAAAQFNKALAADPKCAAAHNDLGNLAFLAGDFAAAEKRYLQAVEADAEDADIWVNLLKTARHLKSKEKAAQYGKKALALDKGLEPVVSTLTKGI
jgi:tetratricopeptide (TPR) repeat protein